MSARAWPETLRFQRAKQRLHITFDDGEAFELAYKTLRAESPSAEVQGHGPGSKPAPAKISDDITVDKADPVGRYAVRIYFSDGHSSGLFTWAYLRELGEKRGQNA